MALREVRGGSRGSWVYGGADARPDSGWIQIQLANEFEEDADGAVGLDRMAEGAIEVERVRVSATVATAIEDAFALEVAHDHLDGALGDADVGGHVAEAWRLLRREAEQDVGVVAQERPPGGCAGRRPGGGAGNRRATAGSARHARILAYETPFV